MAPDPRTSRNFLAEVDESGDALRVPKILFKRDNFSKILFAELTRTNDDLPNQDFLDHLARHFRVDITASEEGLDIVYYIGANVKYGQTLDALSTLYDFVGDAQNNSPKKYKYSADTLDWYSRARARYERNYNFHAEIPRLAKDGTPLSFINSIASQMELDSADIKVHEDKDTIHLFSNSEAGLERVKHALAALQPMKKRLEDQKQRRNLMHRIHQNYLNAAANLKTITHICDAMETHQADEQRRLALCQDEEEKPKRVTQLDKIGSALERLYERDPETEIAPYIRQLQDLTEQADRAMALIKVSEEKAKQQQKSLAITEDDTQAERQSKIKALAALDTTTHNAASEDDKTLEKLAISSQELYTAATKVMAFTKQMLVDAGSPAYTEVKAEKNRYRAAKKAIEIPPETLSALIEDAIETHPLPPEDRVNLDTEDIEDDPYKITEDEIIREELKIHEGRQRMSKRRSEPQTEELFYHNGVNLSPLAQHLHENGDQAFVDVFTHSDLIVPLKVIQHSTHAEFGFEIAKTKHSNADERFDLAKSILAELAAIGTTNGFGTLTDEYIADFVNAKLTAKQNVDDSYEDEPMGFLANYEAHDFFLNKKKNKLLSVFEDEKGIQLVPAERDGNKGFDVYVKTQTEEQTTRDLDDIKDVSMVLEMVADAHYNGKPTAVTQQKLSNWLKDAENTYRKHFLNETEASAAARPQRPSAGQPADRSVLKQEFNTSADYVKDIFIIPQRTQEAEKTIRRIRPASYTPISKSQDVLYDALTEHNMNVVLGAAATGKTDASVSAALQKLVSGEVDKIVITRPAVEAGENLGFLPGNMKEKLDPYLQPLFDVLEKRLAGGDIKAGKDILRQLTAQNIIEIVPLAFMRGRTMTKTFVIVDEAQNASIGQLKAVMTRMGPESHMMISGDKSQSDLPVGVSGLDIVANAFEGVDGFNIVRMDPKDAIARDPLVQKMVEVFEDIDLPDEAGGVMTPGLAGGLSSHPQAGSLTAVFMSHAVPMLIQDFKEAGYSTADITKTGLEIQKMEQKGASAEDIIDYLDAKIKQKRGPTPNP